MELHPSFPPPTSPPDSIFVLAPVPQPLFAPWLHSQGNKKNQEQKGEKPNSFLFQHKKQLFEVQLRVP